MGKKFTSGRTLGPILQWWIQIPQAIKKFTSGRTLGPILQWWIQIPQAIGLWVKNLLW
jgi:hypothetical protein